MSLFKKVEDNHSCIVKQALLGSVIGWVFKNPMKALGAAFTASEVKENIGKSSQVVQNAKNRIAKDLANTTQRVGL